MKIVKSHKDNDRRYVVAAFISTLVLLVFLLFVFLIYPQFNKGNNRPTQYSREINITDITSDTHLNTDKSLVFSYDDGNEVVTFTSTSSGVFIGVYPNPTYIYSAITSSPNTVSITYSNGAFSNISFKVTISDDSGNNQRLLNEDEYEVNDKTFTYSSSSSIYIYKVVINYYK